MDMMNKSVNDADQRWKVNGAKSQQRRLQNWKIL